MCLSFLPPLLIFVFRRFFRDKRTSSSPTKSSAKKTIKNSGCIQSSQGETLRQKHWIRNFPPLLFFYLVCVKRYVAMPGSVQCTHIPKYTLFPTISWATEKIWTQPLASRRTPPPKEKNCKENLCEEDTVILSFLDFNLEADLGFFVELKVRTASALQKKNWWSWRQFSLSVSLVAMK